MKLNKIEKALMNNGIRALLQRYYEAPLLERLGGRVEGQRVLEIGCGRGVGTQIIFERFGAKEVHAFDLDADMVNQARQRLWAYLPLRLKIWVGDVTVIEAENETYDVVFNFGTIHHVPEWQTALSEVWRVLRPGGLFFFEEVTNHVLNRWLYRTFLDHPKENRFSSQEFLTELKVQGFEITPKDVVERFFGDFIIGVATRSHRELSLSRPQPVVTSLIK